MSVIGTAVPYLDAAATLRRYGLHARKQLGQSFLVDPGALEQIAATAEIDRSDTVLEIGAGLGHLTRYLARAAGKVLAVEIDARLLPPLRDVTDVYANVEVVQGDILELSPANLGLQSGYLLVANIPYYITSAVVRHVLESEPKPRRIVLTLQAEVAERICAGPGDLSLLALSVQVYGRPSLRARIPAAAFHPVPKVDSATLSVDVYLKPLIAAALLPMFFRLIKAGFHQKRKMLHNSLAAGLGRKPADLGTWLEAAGIDSKRRAETLSIDEWRRLCESFGGAAD